MFQNSPKLDDEGYSIRPDDDAEEEDILGFVALDLMKHFPQIVSLNISRLLLVYSQRLSIIHSYESLMKLQSNKGHAYTTQQSACKVIKVQAEE